jgi:hypothetical protein
MIVSYVFILQYTIKDTSFSSEIKGLVLLEVKFHQKFSSISGLVPLEVLFHQRFRSIGLIGGSGIIGSVSLEGQELKVQSYWRF